jgi:cytochrome c biogenesis protein CcmG/thiol:disulfide interchange protein DsbE
MPQLRTVIRLVGVAGLLGLLVVIMLGGGRPLEAGVQAPATSGTTIDGEDFDLKRWEGHVVVVNIWATWCGPCLIELPEFADAAWRWNNEGVRFVGLAVDSPPADIPRVIERFQVPYPIVPINGRTQGAWNATSIPSTFIVKADGTVAWSVRGAIHGHELDEILHEVTGRPTPAARPAPAMPAAPASP